MFRGDVQFRPGQRFERECIRAEFLEVDANALATAIRFEVTDPSSCRPTFMHWEAGGPAPLELPEQGESVTLEAAQIP